MPGPASTRATKIGLIAAMLAIVVAAITWGQIVRSPVTTPPSADQDALLVIEHGGSLPQRPTTQRPATQRPAPNARPARGSPSRPAPEERQRPTSPQREERERRDPARTYLVREGDSLYRIADSVYGEADRWPEIAAANGLRKPYWIREGETLRIP